MTDENTARRHGLERLLELAGVEKPQIYLFDTRAGAMQFSYEKDGKTHDVNVLDEDVQKHVVQGH